MVKTVVEARKKYAMMSQSCKIDIARQLSDMVRLTGNPLLNESFYYFFWKHIVSKNL